MLGSITNITSALNPGTVSQYEYSINKPNSSSGQVLKYYEDKHRIVMALYWCLSNLPVESCKIAPGSEEKTKAMPSTMFPSSWFYRKLGALAYGSITGSLVVRRWLHRPFFESKTIDLESSNSISWLSLRVFHHWLLTNTSFSINGITLRKLLGRHLVESLGETAFPKSTLIFSFTESISVLCILLYGPLAALLFILYPRYSNSKMLVPTITMSIIWFVSSFLPLVIYWHCWMSWLKALKNMRSLLSSLGKTGPLAKKLLFSDKGFIGMTTSEGKVGDKICFLVGCRSGVLLPTNR